MRRATIAPNNTPGFWRAHTLSLARRDLIFVNTHGGNSGEGDGKFCVLPCLLSALSLASLCPETQNFRKWRWDPETNLELNKHIDFFTTTLMMERNNIELFPCAVVDSLIKAVH